MSSDASAAAASPMINGIPREGSHREADASTGTAIVPSSSPTTLLDVCADLHQRLTNFLNAASDNHITRRAQDQTRLACQVVEKALKDYDFDELSLSYNGGKDCLVLLIIYLAVLHTHFTQPTGRRKDDVPQLLPSIYAKPPDPFPSVTSFVESSSKEYCLDLVHISTSPKVHPHLPETKSPPASPPNPTETSAPAIVPLANVPDQKEDETVKVVTFRDAFAHYLETHPNVKAIFVGTRRTDPHGGRLTNFDMTDGIWPRFMRIHPVIDWHLDEIWAFLRSPHLADRKNGKEFLEYCDMYDQGYTSLGGVGDTLRNPKLRYTNPDTGEEQYKPAYALTADSEERLGRE